MNKSKDIDWAKVAGKAAEKVRPETASKYFPKNPLRRFIINNFMRRLETALSSLAWQSLLDVGCGEGLVDYFLAGRFNGRRIVGVDADAAALDVARAINPLLEFKEADARALPFPDRSFDAVICLEVLEHLEDYTKVIGEVKRVTRGFAVFSVPAWPFYQGTNFMIGKNWSRLGEHPDHLARFTRASLHHDLARVFTGPLAIRLSYPWLIAVCG
jgi:2-polyprenyl-3-methyl-5-hydroxy-6-metoxy-1,4-benzoquinol methylase